LLAVSCQHSIPMTETEADTISLVSVNELDTNLSTTSIETTKYALVTSRIDKEKALQVIDIESSSILASFSCNQGRIFRECYSA
jgi:hypothetical protein